MALDATVQNKSLPHYLIDFRIAGALIKKYCNRLRSDVENTETVASYTVHETIKRRHRLRHRRVTFFVTVTVT